MKHTLSAGMLFIILSSGSLFCGPLSPADETEHFTFFAAARGGDVDRVKNALESNYARITGFYGVVFGEKIAVELYPDIEEYHAAIGMPDAPDWMVGSTAADRKILMVTPGNAGSLHTYENMLCVAVHEFTHLVTARINRDIPVWLSEGTALYESGQYIQTHRTDVIRSMLPENRLPSLEMLERNFLLYFGYSVSGTIVDFIITGYGKDRLIRFIRQPWKYQECFGCSKTEFSEHWKNFITARVLESRESVNAYRN